MSGVSTTSTTTLKTDVTSKVLPGDKSGLPLEIWQIIFSYLSVRDLCCVAGVSKTWYDLSLSMDSRRWKELYLACREWRHPYWPLNIHVEPSSWKQAYRNQYLSTRFWYRCSRQAHKAGCMTLLKRSRERHTLEVGPGLQYETLKSAFAVAGEYDRILVHPGIYDEQLEMSLKVPFELVGVGELGSVILVVCLECVALSGRLSNLVLRAPWFTNFVLKVRCGYLQMDNCIMEDGMMCVVNPAACHIQFCTFRHATVILQHVGASIITNCEFSQSDNANIVVEGYPKEEKSWAYPHLCQQMDGVFSGRQGTGHKLKVTDSLTSTLHSTFTTKSFTASTIKTCDTLSRGRAGSQEVEFSGMNISVGSGSNVNSHGGANVDVSGSCPVCQGGANVDATGSTDVSGANVNNHGAHLCRLHCRQTNSVGAALDGGGSGADNAASEGGMSVTSVSRFSGFSNSGEGNGGSKPPRCRACMESSSRNAVATGTCPVCGRELLALSANPSANDDDEAEWLEIDDERKAWQLEGERRRGRGRTSQPPDFAAGVLPPQREDNTLLQPGTIATQGFPPFAVSQTGSSKDADTDVSFEKRDAQKPFDKREAPKWDGEKGDTRHHRDGCSGCREGSRDGHAAGFAAGTRLGGPGPELQPSGCGDLSASDDPHRCCQSCDSKERSVVAQDSREQQTVPTAVTSAADSGGGRFRLTQGDGSLGQGLGLGRHQNGGDGLLSGDVFPQNFPPLTNHPSHRYHYHSPPLLHNPHPHPPSSAQGYGALSQPGEGTLGPGGDPQQPSLHGSGRGDREERRSQRSFRSSRNGESSSDDDDDDLSILNGLESGGSSGGGSNHGNNSTSSSDDDSEVEEFFRADSAYDCSDAEESVIMLPHLRQQHLEASLSANAVNADVGSICSQASQPITLSASQDEGVLSHIRTVRGCLVHQCRMMHSKGGVMVSLQAHALISGCDVSNVSYGIRCIQNARVVVLKNRIHHCRTSGIFMRLAASGLIAGNDIHSNNEAGLDIRKNADPIVQNNRIHHGKRSGVVVLGSGRGQIRNNNIYGNTEAGIYILYGGNPTVSENNIYDGRAAGVAVNEGGQGFIFDNTISSNQWGGVDIRRGSCPMVCRNTITNGLGDGIVIGDQGQGTIENNIISDNAGCGLWLMSASRPYIHGNQISNNGDTGVMMVNKTDIQHEGSHLLPAGAESVDHISRSLSMMGGLLDDMPAPRPRCAHTTLQHNNIYHNAGRGVAVELGDKVDVLYNAIYANQQDGVWVHQESPMTLHGNSISSNRGHGVITALTSSMEISGNGIYDNRDCGIVCSGCVDITENDVVGNQAGGIIVDNGSVTKVSGNRIQAPSGHPVKVAASATDTEIQGNQLYRCASREVLDLSERAVICDNKVTPSAAPHEKGVSSSRVKSRDTAFNKAQFLRDPPPRPAIQPPPPPSNLPAHNISSVTKVMVPSGDTCQQGSKLCRIL